MIGRRPCSEGASLRSFSWQLDAIAIDVGSQDVLLGDDRSLLDELGRLRPALQSCGLRGWRGTASRTAWNASLGLHFAAALAVAGSRRPPGRMRLP